MRYIQLSVRTFECFAFYSCRTGCADFGTLRLSPRIAPLKVVPRKWLIVWGALAFSGNSDRSSSQRTQHNPIAAAGLLHSTGGLRL